MNPIPEQPGCMSIGALARAMDKHISTIIRWTRRGVRGQVLRSYLIGGQRLIADEDGTRSGATVTLDLDREERLLPISELLHDEGYDSLRGECANTNKVTIILNDLLDFTDRERFAVLDFAVAHANEIQV